jgi:HNH endonuclease
VNDPRFRCLGEPRYIPAATRLAVRQAARFGCCYCGCPIIEYHHIEPYSESKRHLSSNIVALCPNCHRMADKGGPWSQDTVREFKRTPHNTKMTKAKFAVFTPRFKVRLGHWEFQDCDDLLAIGHEVVLRTRRDKNGIVRVSGTLHTPDGEPFALIDENEWQVSLENVWDVEFNAARHLTVRRAARDILEWTSRILRLSCSRRLSGMLGGW